MKVILIGTAFGLTQIPYGDPKLKWLALAFILAGWLDHRRSARRADSARLGAESSPAELTRN